MTVHEAIIPESLSGLRADKALSRLLPQVPGYAIREAFQKRDVKLNGQRIAPDTIVSPGDALLAYIKEKAVALPPDIVFADDHYVVVNKRQGLPVQGEGSLEGQLSALLRMPIHACHRLDAMTGGLILLAKTERDAEVAREAFAQHRVEKTYRALVRGCPKPPEGLLCAYLRKDAERAKVWIYEDPVPGALPIKTGYRVVEGGEVSRLEIQLITGRTHQIRAHLAHVGHPILGDDKYGDRTFNRTHGVLRQRLWATRLTLWDGRTFTVPEGF